MRPDIGSWLHVAGILGMNRRNAEYILRCNPRSSFPFVDDKVMTKRLAVEHGIPIPELFHVVEQHGDIRHFEKKLGGRDEFVVKPARGAGGSGIVLVTGRTPDGFKKQNGEVIAKDDFYYHLFGILSGTHSLEGLEDKVIFEALVHVDPVFSAITWQGVPDVRLIVYRGVPVMGMLRLPTRASDGKANIHRGAIGVGIRISNGETLSAVHNTKLIDTHPDTGRPVRGIQVPHWEILLNMAARTSDMIGLGYIGADWVLDKDKGPLLLELNARPGLAIQLANQAGLRKRLEEVDRAPSDIFNSPAARVAWAKEKF
jgi:alpha-L-glutamate ligase-like protein